MMDLEKNSTDRNRETLKKLEEIIDQERDTHRILIRQHEMQLFNQEQEIKRLE